MTSRPDRPVARHGDDEGVRDALGRLARRCLQLLVVGATIGLVVWLLGRILVVVVPVVVAVLLTTLLEPPARRLREHGVPPALATGLVFLGAGAVLTVLALVLGPRILASVNDLSGSVGNALVKLQQFGQDKLGLDPGQLDRLLGEAQRYFFGGTGVNTAVTGVRTAAEVLTGLILTVFLAVYFVNDGQRLAHGVLRIAPEAARDRLAVVGRVTWTVLGGYVRGSALVGLADGVLIGTGLWLLDVRLALTLGVVTFFGAFVPLIGAFVSGLLAAVVALVDRGPAVAAAVVALTLVVQQVEGNLLSPRILARTVALHPVVTTCAVTTGGLVGGVFGAFVAVPVTAVAGALVRDGWGGDDAAAGDGVEGPGEGPSPDAAQSPRDGDDDA